MLREFFVKHSSRFTNGNLCVLFAAIGAISAAFLVNAGCSRSGGSVASGVFRIPWPDNEGRYSLQNVSIQSYDRPEALQGRFANILVDPRVADGRVESSDPRGRYIRNSQGVALAADFSSLQAAVIHAHFERLAALDAEAGVAIQWPVRIGIQANVRESREGGGNVRDNALYVSSLDTLLIVPYQGARLPISLNAGILAHEHFHMIFQAAVLNKLSKDAGVVPRAHALEERCDWAALTLTKDMFGKTLNGRGGDKPASESLRVNAFILRAINEGLADYWGWMYSNDPQFITPSLPNELVKHRRLDVEGQPRLPSRKRIIDWVKENSEPAATSAIITNAYFLGTSYARIFRELALAPVSEKATAEKSATAASKMKVAKAIIRALPKFAENASKAIVKDEVVSPNALLLAFQEAMVDIDDRGCATLKGSMAPEESSTDRTAESKCPVSVGRVKEGR